MADEDIERAPFVDQIVKKTLETLLKQEEFDKATISRLRKLVHAKRLQNFESVVGALVGEEETQSETP